MEMNLELAEAKKTMEEITKLRIGIIGIGNAGNQVVVKAYDRGYKVLAINSSVKDLHDSVLANDIPSFIVGDEARGSGKNRELAKKLFKTTGKKLFGYTQFTNMIEGSDIVYIVSSTAGGTGSGIAPEAMKLLRAMYPSKIFIYFGILPKFSESPLGQYNTIDCLTEISDQKCTYALADLAHFEDRSNDVAYNGAAEYILQTIDIISGKYLLYSKSGMIDENDMKTIVGETGYLSTYMLDKITQSMLDQHSLQSLMIRTIKNNAAAPINRDGIIKHLGVISNFPEEMEEASKSGNYKEITDYIGSPISTFENYSVTNSSLGQFILILSGMNLPYSRVLRCKEIIKEANIKKQKEIDLSKDKEELDFIKEEMSTFSRRKDINKEEEESKRDSILSDFFD